MALKKLDHVSLLLKNPKSTIEFYKNVLGFEVVSEHNLEKMHMKVFNLKARGDYIEIIQPTAPEIQMANGIKHIAFLSDDIEGDFLKIKESGANMLHKEVQRHEKTAFFFIKSPGGEFVEIIQYL